MGKRMMKGIMFTDIHWGRKNNSEEHNNDCYNFIEWLCDIVRSRPDIEYVAFLGDWHENRSSLNINTLKRSLQGARLLNQLDIPIFFIVGNHDLYYRHSRETHSLHHLEELSNFVLIDEPIVVDTIHNGVLFSPYLFSEEYADLKEYNKVPVWMGHFEFKGFVITGYNITMPTGPDKEDFGAPTHIFSGHFHKRQNQRNIHYIGNTFPMDFSDAGDSARGCAIFDHASGEIEYINWESCPKYERVRLSEVLNGTRTFESNTRVNCVVDAPLNHQESIELREKLSLQFNLREFVLDESIDLSDVKLQKTEGEDFDETATVDEIVMEMLRGIQVDQIDNDLLVSCYEELNNEQ